MSLLPSSMAVKTEPPEEDIPETQSESTAIFPSRQQSNSPTDPTAPLLMLISSVNDLRTLSTALHHFYSKYDDLQNHLDSIQKSIHSLAQHQRWNHEEEPKKNYVDEISSAPENNSNSTADAAAAKPVVAVSSSTRGGPELELLCQRMCGKELRRYIAFNLDEVPKIRHEVPKALTLAPSPAKLVLECIGKFFLQGSKAYTKDSPMISGRQAAILIAEFYLLSDCCKEMDDTLKDEAETASVAWRKRLLLEGGIQNASQIDARGLLLFIGSFGIPPLFRRDEVVELILLSHPKEISVALARSHHLAPKVADWIPKLIKCGMRVKAVNLAYIFGLHDKFQPQPILSLHLKESCERRKREAQALPHKAMEAAEKHLASLKSVIECLEYHEIDHSKLLPGWHIKEMIVKAEKDLSEYLKKVEEKALQKRQLEEVESQRKRQRYITEASLIPSQLTRLHDGRLATTHLDHYSPYDVGRKYLGSSHSGLRDEILVDKYGRAINSTSRPYGWKVASAAYDDRLAAAYDDRLAASHVMAGKQIGDSLFARSSTLEGFPGLQNIPSAAATARTAVHDLYQFADSIEGQPRYTSTAHQEGAAPTMPAQHASYYYQ